MSFLGGGGVIKRFYTPPPASALDSSTTAWIAAVGTVGATQQTNIDTLIRGLKTDSLFTLLDAMWIYAGAENGTQAGTDIINLHVHVANGSPSLTTDGYTGNGSSIYLNTNFTGWTNYTQNSGTFGAFDMTNSTTTGSDNLMGCFDGSNNLSDLIVMLGASTPLCRVNATGGGAITGSSDSNRRGMYVCSRSGANQQDLYKNGSSIGTNASAAGQVTSGLPAFTIFARNDSGTPSGYTTDTAGASFIGAGLSATQALNISTRLNTYMTAVGAYHY